jgi:hypothetical protein
VVVERFGSAEDCSAALGGGGGGDGGAGAAEECRGVLVLRWGDGDLFSAACGIDMDAALQEGFADIRTDDQGPGGYVFRPDSRPLVVVQSRGQARAPTPTCPRDNPPPRAPPSFPFSAFSAAPPPALLLASSLRPPELPPRASCHRGAERSGSG